MDESTRERLRDPARLFADQYELTMLAAYGACGMDATATFSLFVRELPTSRNFLLACGLDDLLSELDTFRFSADDIAYLRSLDLLPESLFSALSDFRFDGDVFAAPEGTPIFPGEPILERGTST
jgi:nicotinate phosphoribosyltransferase